MYERKKFLKIALIIGGVALVALGALATSDSVRGQFGNAPRIFQPIQGGTGTSTAPSFGDVLVGNSDGTYDVQATSTLGISGGSDLEILDESSTLTTAAESIDYTGAGIVCTTSGNDVTCDVTGGGGGGSGVLSTTTGDVIYNNDHAALVLSLNGTQNATSSDFTEGTDFLEVYAGGLFHQQLRTLSDLSGANITATGTLDVTGLSTLTGGFLSQASSTLTGTLHADATIDFQNQFVIDADTFNSIDRFIIKAVGADSGSELFLHPTGSASRSRLTVSNASSATNFAGVSLETLDGRNILHAITAGTGTLEPIDIAFNGAATSTFDVNGGFTTGNATMTNATATDLAITRVNISDDVIEDFNGSGLSVSGGILGCDTANGSTFGCLLAADWTIFNNKVSTTSIDTETELESLLTDVTNVFTNNDGALADDDLSDDDLDALQNVTALTESTGDFLYYNGAAWDAIASSSLFFASSTLLADDNTFSSSNIDLTGYDCSGNANGGALTVDASGNLTCTDDDASAGSGGSNWEFTAAGDAIRPTSTVGAIISASSTVLGGFTTDDATSTSATTTNLRVDNNFNIAGTILYSDNVGLVGPGLRMDDAAAGGLLLDDQDNVALINDTDYTSFIYLSDSPGIQIESNVNEGVQLKSADRRFEFGAYTGGTDAHLDFSDIATSEKTFTFPNWAGDIVVSTGTTQVSSINATSSSDTSFFAGNVDFGSSIIISDDTINDFAGSGLSVSGNALTCDTANGSTFGCLLAADWTIFNNKVSSSSIDTFSELDSLVADRSLINQTDVASTLEVTDATTTNATTTTLAITSLDCTGNSNGGALTADANGLVTCSDDDSTAGASGSNWQFTDAADAITPTTTVGIIVSASSTIDANLTTTGLFTVGTESTSGTSTMKLGPSASNQYVLGTGWDDDAFKIASSSSLDGGQTDLLSIAKTGTSTWSNGLDLDNGCFAINGTCIGGGGGTPGGSDTHVQYNNGGSFGGDAAFVFDDVFKELTVTRADFTHSTSTNATSTNMAISSDFWLNAERFTSLTGSGLSVSSGALTCDTADSSTFGCLSSADWTVFNNKVSSTSIDSYSELNTLVSDVTLTHNGLIDTYSELNTIVSDVTLTHNGLIDTFAELDAIVADKSLANLDDAQTFSSLLTFTSGFISNASSTIVGDLTIDSSGTLHTNTLNLQNNGNITVDGNNATATAKLMAIEGVGKVTNGAAGIFQVEFNTSLNNYDVLDFVDTNDTCAYWNETMPAGWDGGALDASFYWTATTSSGSVAWGIKSVAFGNDDALDTAPTATTTVYSTLTATNDLQVSTTTAKFTPEGTPAGGDLLYIEVCRDTSDAVDDLATNARLLHINLEYARSTFSD